MNVEDFSGIQKAEFIKSKEATRVYFWFMLIVGVTHLSMRAMMMFLTLTC